MVNPRSKTAGKKDCGSWEPVVRPPLPPPLEVPTCPGTQHGSSDTLLEILLGMQQKQQEQMTLLQQQMTLLQQQMAAQQKQIELQQQQQQARPSSNYFLALKEVHAPNFAGSKDPLEAEKWIAEMEKFCRALCIPKDEWVNVTIPFLIADAEAWFISVRHAYESGGVRINWAQFRDIFFLNYFPTTFRIEKENEFFNLKQGSMTVIQYASMFNQLGRFAPAFMVQDQSTITRFEEGLNLNLREHMGTPKATTYEEILEQALQAERLITERNQIRDSNRPRPWNEQYEETESDANKKATSANEKAIQEDLDGSTVHEQDDEGLIGCPFLSSIGIKRTGELDSNLINEAMKRTFRNEAEPEKRAFELCSLWEEYLKDPDWFPRTLIFHRIGQAEEVFVENDRRLNDFKATYGDAVYNAVIAAISEINGYNPTSGIYLVKGLWGIVERRAHLEEGVGILMRTWRTILRLRETLCHDPKE